MEVVNHSTTRDAASSNPNEDIYPVKTKLIARQSEQTERTARFSDFSDFTPDALGEVGFAYKDDSARTRSTVNMDDSYRTRDDSFRSRSTRLSFSAPYNLDLQTENEELKLELINVQAERDDLKTQISLMSWEIAQLRDQLKMRDNQLVRQELAHTAAKRASFESEKTSNAVAPDTPNKRKSLLGRVFTRMSSKRSLLSEVGDEEEAQSLPMEVSVPVSPKKNRRNMLKRIFSGKGKDTFKEAPMSSESVLDDSIRSQPQKQQQQQQEPVQYLDWHRDAKPQIPRVTMAGYMNSPTVKKKERVQILHWSRTPIEEETSISGDSEMDSTCRQHLGQEEYLQILDKSNTLDTIVSAEEELVHEVQWYREAPPASPVLNIQWERVPVTPVLNIQWQRIPSSRNLGAAKEEPVHNIKWERIPSSRKLGAVKQEPVINIKWERIPSSRNLNAKQEPVINIKWERIPSARNLAPVLNIQWQRIPSTRQLLVKEEAATPVLNIKWERIPSSRNLAVKSDEPVHEVHWYRVPTAPVINIKWERIPSSRKLVVKSEEPVHEVHWYRTVKKQEPVHELQWYRVPPTPVINVKWERIPSSRKLVVESEEPVHEVHWYRAVKKQELVHELHWYRGVRKQEPVHELQWYRVPPTPVINVKWERIPSSRNLAAVQKKEELVHELVWSRAPPTPVLDVKWERVPSTRNIFTIEEEYPKSDEIPVIDVRWERLPSEPVMNIQWQRVRSSTTLLREKEEEELAKEPEDSRAAEYERYLNDSFSVSGKETYDDASDDEDLDLAVVESLTHAAAAATQQMVERDWSEAGQDNYLVSPTPTLKSCLKSPGSSKKSKKKTAGFFENNITEVEVDMDAPPKKRGVMIRESFNQVTRVSKIRGSAWDNCFFTEDEMADFKYEAFMEQCGLTEDDF